MDRARAAGRMVPRVVWAPLSVALSLAVSACDSPDAECPFLDVHDDASMAQLQLRSGRRFASGPAAGAAGADLEVSQATLAADLQAQFDVVPKSGVRGWLGADADASVVVGGGRTGRRALWLFSDTLFGEFDGNAQTRVVKGRQMPHSTVALIECTNTTCGGRPTFYARPNSTAPAPGKLQVQSFFRPPREQEVLGQHLWPVAAIAARDGKSVIGLAIRFSGTDLATLVVYGATAIIITGVADRDDPRDWNYTTYDFGRTGWNWFSAIGYAEAQGDALYIWGHFGNDKSKTYLARGAYSRLLAGDFECLQYWTGAERASGAFAPWVDDGKRLLAIGTPSWEATFDWSEPLGVWYTFYMDAMAPTDIYMWTAEKMTGPWSQTHIFAVPAPFGTPGSGWMCYATKAHPELAAPANGTSAELVLTYICNVANNGIEPLYDNLSMFWPKRGYWPNILRLRATAHPQRAEIA